MNGIDCNKNIADILTLQSGGHHHHHPKDMRVMSVSYEVAYLKFHILTRSQFMSANNKIYAK